LYVTPKNKHSDVPDKYKSIIESNPEIFPNLDNVSDKIWSDENNSSVIECKRVPYISKCNLLGVNFVDFTSYIEIMRNKITNIEIENNDPVITKFNTKLDGGAIKDRLQKLEFFKCVFPIQIKLKYN